MLSWVIAQIMLNLLCKVIGSYVSVHPPPFRDIEGAWQADGFTLLVDHVQGDPYASPSRFRVQVSKVRDAQAPSSSAMCANLS